MELRVTAIEVMHSVINNSVTAVYKDEWRKISYNTRFSKTFQWRWCCSCEGCVFCLLGGGSATRDPAQPSGAKQVCRVAQSEWKLLIGIFLFKILRIITPTFFDRWVMEYFWMYLGYGKKSHGRYGCCCLSVSFLCLLFFPHHNPRFVLTIWMDLLLA